MEKRMFKDIALPLLGFGCMRLPMINGEIDRAHTEKMIDYAINNGVNYFDTAYMYHSGKSEPVTGEILKKYDRESFYLATKFPTMRTDDPNEIDIIFNDQLSRCQVSYFDFYLMHSLDARLFERAKKMKLYDYMKKQKEEGKIKYIGFSFHDKPEVLEQIVNAYEWDFAQIQLNYFDWSYQDAERSYNILKQKNIPVIVMEPIRGGFLANPTDEGTKLIEQLGSDSAPYSLALRWLAELDNVKVILSGMSDMQQVEQNVAVLANPAPVTEPESQTLSKVVDLINSTKSVPCTGCAYCMECPSGVDIPKSFNIYNYYMVLKNAFRTSIEYFRTFPEQNHAKNCTDCGACVPNCPQHIDIPQELKKVEAQMQAIKF